MNHSGDSPIAYYDTHMHLPSPDAEGVDRLLDHIRTEGDAWRGGNLILNSEQEMLAACEHRDRLTYSLNLVPGLLDAERIPPRLRHSRWWKIHPVLQEIRRHELGLTIGRLKSLRLAPYGVIIHAYPWGPSLEFELSLELVIAAASSFPKTAILVTHGGGYQSWAYRAHVASLPNVFFDFSATLHFLRDSTDILRPMGVYARDRPDQLLFGSDWPVAPPKQQLQRALEVAEDCGVSEADLQRLMLNNSRRLFPEFCRQPTAPMPRPPARPMFVGQHGPPPRIQPRRIVQTQASAARQQVGKLPALPRSNNKPATPSTD